MVQGSESLPELSQLSWSPKRLTNFHISKSVSPVSNQSIDFIPKCHKKVQITLLNSLLQWYPMPKLTLW